LRDAEKHTHLRRRRDGKKEAFVRVGRRGWIVDYGERYRRAQQQAAGATRWTVQLAITGQSRTVRFLFDTLCLVPEGREERGGEVVVVVVVVVADAWFQGKKRSDNSRGGSQDRRTTPIRPFSESFCHSVVELTRVGLEHGQRRVCASGEGGKDALQVHSCGNGLARTRKVED
jgi:hypothetical protein